MLKLQCKTSMHLSFFMLKLQCKLQRTEVLCWNFSAKLQCIQVLCWNFSANFNALKFHVETWVQNFNALKLTLKFQQKTSMHWSFALKFCVEVSTKKLQGFHFVHWSFNIKLQVSRRFPICSTHLLCQFPSLTDLICELKNIVFVPCAVSLHKRIQGFLSFERWRLDFTCQLKTLNPKRFPKKIRQHSASLVRSVWLDLAISPPLRIRQELGVFLRLNRFEKDWIGAFEACYLTGESIDEVESRAAASRSSSFRRSPTVEREWGACGSSDRGCATSHLYALSRSQPCT